MNILTKVLGGLVLLVSLSMWYGHRQYVKRKIPFQYATAYQTILVTFTAIGLLIGCHLWILPISIILWIFMQYLFISWKFSKRKFIEPSSILLFTVWLFSGDFCWSLKFGFLGWIITFVISTILYFIFLALAFPVFENREWK